MTASSSVDGSAVGAIVGSVSCTDEDGGVSVAVSVSGMDGGGGASVAAADSVDISLAADEGVAVCPAQLESTRMFKANIVNKTIERGLPALRRSAV